jgi:putative phage-type endonuclease
MYEIQKDIKEFIYNYDVMFDVEFSSNENQILNVLYVIYDVDDSKLPSDPNKLEEFNCLKYVISNYVSSELKLLYKYFKNTHKVQKLKELVLPEQRSKEWFDMRKNKLTASAFADALNLSHFKTRDESLLDKIIDKPFEANPITEWGVKYEEVATRFYEHITKSKIHEFGLIPHPEFPAFGASPDGICDENSPSDYIGRMLEIKCPPKRKFTKSVPKHYWMQMQGQMEVCDLDECDFLQVKLEEYENFDEYKNDTNDNDDDGLREDNLPKGYTLTYLKSDSDKFHYLYCPLFSSNDEILKWKENMLNFLKKENYSLKEEKFWKITRYECTLVVRDKGWWNDNICNIYKYYNDLLYYKTGDNIEILKKKVLEGSSNKKFYHIKENTIEDFYLITNDEGL